MPPDLLELYTDGNNRTYDAIARNKTLLTGFIRAVKTMESADSIDSLRAFSYLHYERLKYNMGGYSSVRLSNRYVHRLIFKEEQDGIKIEMIKIDDTHYGNK